MCISVHTAIYNALSFYRERNELLDATNLKRLEVFSGDFNRQTCTAIANDLLPDHDNVLQTLIIVSKNTDDKCLGILCSSSWKHNSEAFVSS